MTFRSNRFADKAAALLLTIALLSAPLPSQQQTELRLRSESDLVLVNVTVREERKLCTGIEAGELHHSRR